MFYDATRSHSTVQNARQKDCIMSSGLYSVKLNSQTVGQTSYAVYIYLNRSTPSANARSLM